MYHSFFQLKTIHSLTLLPLQKSTISLYVYFYIVIFLLIRNGVATKAMAILNFIDSVKFFPKR